MPFIAALNPEEFQTLVTGFAQRYVLNWDTWMNAPPDQRAPLLGSTLRGWQACRPNTMRRCRDEADHGAPYLEDLIQQSEHHILALHDFEMGAEDPLTPAAVAHLTNLLEIFEQLSFGNGPREGLAGAVGISKAVLLLTDGRVGPAFDNQVRQNLQLGEIPTSIEWIHSLQFVAADIRAFIDANNMTLQQAVPEFAHLHTGRIYDMAFGPREPDQ